MNLFDKLVALEPLNVSEANLTQVRALARQSVWYDDVPADSAEIIRRIGDADCVLLSFTSRITADVLEACPNIRYIGMFCSLYAPESANVDILAAHKRGIVVRGVRDYGDEGVAEYVISELVRLLHGFGEHQWKREAVELTDVPIGIVGLGTTGLIVARALRFFGAKVSYYSRTRKPEAECADCLEYKPLDALLTESTIVCTCLNRDTVLLHEREFTLMGEGKVLINTSITPSHDVAALAAWLKRPGTFALGDSVASLDPTGALLTCPNVICVKQSAGLSSLARERLAAKALTGMVEFLRGEQ